MENFKQVLENDKAQIDKRIEQTSSQLLSDIANEYGKKYAEVVAAYTDVLSRGGKRLRGVLAKRAYSFFGGPSEEVALDAAVIIEMLHDYLLVIDDIEDVSELRRGKPAAHILLEEYHTKNHLSGNRGHYGMSQAINSALVGQNLALLKALQLPVSAECKVNALTHLNDFLAKTDFGQLGDFNNEAFQTDQEADVLQVMRLKTAYYTFCMPIYFGAALAGVSKLDPNLDAYLVNAGISFQIYDDIIGTLGDVSKTGKSNMSDIIEGKRTLLVIYAFEKADSAQKATLLQALGNGDLTDEGFVAAQAVIRDTGALARCQSEVNRLIDEATASLKKSENTPAEMIEFLTGFAAYVAKSVQV